MANNKAFQEIEKHIMPPKTLIEELGIYPEDEENQFDVLKEETYQGIIDVWDQDYESGFERLNGVLEHSTKISLSTCKLVTDTKWIGNLQRRGVCHFLVEEGSIEGWIINEQTI